MTDQEIINRIALLQVKGVGTLRAKKLITAYGSATAVFQNRKNPGLSIDSIGTVHWNSLKKFSDFGPAKRELEIIKKNKIQFLAFDQDNYPSKLKRAIDCPAFLFYKGTDAIHNTRVISIIGTRACSEYGKLMCEKIIEGLAPYNPLIVSGLAYGIDTTAHRSALQNNLNTMGVMATGLDALYPSQNKKMAHQMLEQGGLLTEYPFGTNPDRENFPTRNRIVAGMSDAVIVIETAKKGGSMITADLAFSYNRDVFCIPGKVGEKRSEGCNFLIKSLRGNLITSAEDVLYNLNWDDSLKKDTPQRKLFVDLSPDEQKLYDCLQGAGGMHIDELFIRTEMPMSKLSTMLLQLEMTGMVRSMPGKQYQAV
jgi:DNA processing protein